MGSTITGIGRRIELWSILLLLVGGCSDQPASGVKAVYTFSKAEAFRQLKEAELFPAIVQALTSSQGQKVYPAAVSVSMGQGSWFTDYVKSEFEKLNAVVDYMNTNDSQLVSPDLETSNLGIYILFVVRDVWEVYDIIMASLDSNHQPTTSNVWALYLKEINQTAGKTIDPGMQAQLEIERDSFIEFLINQYKTDPLNTRNELRVLRDQYAVLSCKMQVQKVESGIYSVPQCAESQGESGGQLVGTPIIMTALAIFGAVQAGKAVWDMSKNTAVGNFIRQSASNAVDGTMGMLPPSAQEKINTWSATATTQYQQGVQTVKNYKDEAVKWAAEKTGYPPKTIEHGVNGTIAAGEMALNVASIAGAGRAILRNSDEIIRGIKEAPEMMRNMRGALDELRGMDLQAIGAKVEDLSNNQVVKAGTQGNDIVGAGETVSESFFKATEQIEQAVAAMPPDTDPTQPIIDDGSNQMEVAATNGLTLPSAEPPATSSLVKEH